MKRIVAVVLHAGKKGATSEVPASSLPALAETLLAFGATTSFDDAQQVVWVDVTGCGHLHRSPSDPTGESTLLHRLATQLAAAQTHAHVALADGPTVAAAVARFAPAAAHGPLRVPPGENAAALARLPVEALPLTADVAQWLHRLGVHRVQQMQQLPRAALAVRLGGLATRILALLAGEDPWPLVPYVPPEVPEESVELEHEIDSSEALLFVAKMLCDRLAGRLRGRRVRVSRFELVLGLARQTATATPPVCLEVPLAVPLLEAADLLRVLRVHVESYVVTSPLRAVTLRAAACVAHPEATLPLWGHNLKLERALPRLVAELEAELGTEHVGVLQVADCWSPAQRSRLVPFSAPSPAVALRVPLPDAPVGALLADLPEPCRWLPIPLQLHESFAVTGPTFRFEAVAWWSQGPSVYEYATVWNPRCAAFAWVEMSRRGARIRGWLA